MPIEALSNFISGLDYANEFFYTEFLDEFVVKLQEAV